MHVFIYMHMRGGRNTSMCTCGGGFRVFFSMVFELIFWDRNLFSKPELTVLLGWQARTPGSHLSLIPC